MKSIKSILVVALVSLTACAGDDLTPVTPEVLPGEAVQITTVTLGQMQDGGSTRSGAGVPSSGCIKTAFVAGDVLHFRFEYASKQGDTDPLYSGYNFAKATCGIDGRWTLTPTVILPKNLVSLGILVFYDGHQVNYDTPSLFSNAFNAIRLYTSNLTYYEDRLFGEYINVVDAPGFPVCSGVSYDIGNGSLTLSLSHLCAHLHVPQVSVNGLPALQELAVRLNNNAPEDFFADGGDYSAERNSILAPLVASPGTPGLFEVILPFASEGDFWQSTTVITHFVATLADGSRVEFPVPDAVSDPSSRRYPNGSSVNSGGASTALHGRSLRFNESYTYRLYITPGSASVLVGDAPGWDSPEYVDGITSKLYRYK